MSRTSATTLLVAPCSSANRRNFGVPSGRNPPIKRRKLGQTLPFEVFAPVRLAARKIKHDVVVETSMPSCGMTENHSRVPRRLEEMDQRTASRPHRVAEARRRWDEVRVPLREAAMDGCSRASNAGTVLQTARHGSGSCQMPCRRRLRI